MEEGTGGVEGGNMACSSQSVWASERPSTSSESIFQIRTSDSDDACCDLPRPRKRGVQQREEEVSPTHPGISILTRRDLVHPRLHWAGSGQGCCHAKGANIFQSSVLRLDTRGL
ncbi:hypothetical protein MGYG_05460 [Nannizzia gypsea CBS 118893]|uniref:Uncharacterized protein n=1 Tax=Arthroderma gypseum (strain ATCC MYA-4604 / CBS 118893) TaxID=535722 RepID=E4UW19_ARTGP|nr:hypothetical protein MGYG_05460 [Nannizzia gypsea CBS 118893]EFR02467.1 hypothetical protein MGYG_05460 [Nannizzia gypsea CBS 118893]